MPLSAAARPLELGISDPAVADSDAELRLERIDEIAATGAERAIRIAGWRAIAPAELPPGFDPTDPADPNYKWTNLDHTVRDATDAGLDLILTVHSAPDWAEGDRRPPDAKPGSWRPDPEALGQFGAALARRYRGDFPDPERPGEMLPRVDDLQLWLEANLAAQLSPQVSGINSNRPNRVSSVEVYRGMLNSFYASVKRVDPKINVITTGTAPYGDDVGRATRPLEFWRELFCLRGRKLRPTKCPEPAKFDVLAHHPINTTGPPRDVPENRDDISSGNLEVLQVLLRKAEREGQLGGETSRRGFWVTEFWYETEHPQGLRSVSLRTQADYIAESLYLFWQARATVAIYLRVRDIDSTNDPAINPPGIGLRFANGRPKPGLSAFSFPFVADDSGRRLKLWGKAPAAGGVEIEKRSKAGWRSVARLRVGRDRVFYRTLKGVKQRTRFRAVAAGETSRTWAVG